MSIRFNKKEHIWHMKRSGMTTYEMADYMGISQPAVVKMLNQGRDIYIKKNEDSIDIYDVKLLWTRVKL